MTTVLKDTKLRLSPNQHQADQLWQMFDNSRFVWYQILAMTKERYRNNPGSRFGNEYGMNYLLRPLKQEYLFLKKVKSDDLGTSYQLRFAILTFWGDQEGVICKTRQAINMIVANLSRLRLISLSNILKKTNTNKNHLQKLIIFDKVTNCVIRELIRGVIF